MKYFPDKLPVGRLPDREYFWNVFNTLYTDYVTELVAHANKVRCEASTEHQAAQVIEIADEIWDELHAAPFVSCKYLCWVNFFRATRQDTSFAQESIEASSSTPKTSETRYL